MYNCIRCLLLPKRFQTKNICISKGMFVKAINGINQDASDLELTLRDNPLTGNEIALR